MIWGRCLFIGFPAENPSVVSTHLFAYSNMAMYSQKKKANCDCVSQMMSRPFFNGSAREAFDVIGFNGVSLSLSPPGSLLMFAPSSAETSTSIDSGDWLNRAGGGRGLLTSLVPLCRLPSCPPFPPRRPTSPL